MYISPKQLNLLRALAEGKRCAFHPYMGRFNPKEHYYCQSVGNCTPTANALLSRKWARKTQQEQYNRSHVLEITDAGRAALASGGD